MWTGFSVMLKAKPSVCSSVFRVIRGHWRSQVENLSPTIFKTSAYVSRRRRHWMNCPPTNRVPKIIIPQVLGSGTASNVNPHPFNVLT